MNNFWFIVLAVLLVAGVALSVPRRTRPGGLFLLAVAFAVLAYIVGLALQVNTR